MKEHRSAGFNFLFSYALTFEAFYLPDKINQSLLQIFTSAFKSIFAQSLKEQRSFRVVLDAK